MRPANVTKLRAATASWCAPIPTTVVRVASRAGAAVCPVLLVAMASLRALLCACFPSPLRKGFAETSDGADMRNVTTHTERCTTGTSDEAEGNSTTTTRSYTLRRLVTAPLFPSRSPAPCVTKPATGERFAARGLRPPSSRIAGAPLCAPISAHPCSHGPCAPSVVRLRHVWRGRCGLCWRSSAPARC